MQWCRTPKYLCDRFYNLIFKVRVPFGNGRPAGSENKEVQDPIALWLSKERKCFTFACRSNTTLTTSSLPVALRCTILHYLFSSFEKNGNYFGFSHNCVQKKMFGSLKNLVSTIVLAIAKEKKDVIERALEFVWRQSLLHQEGPPTTNCHYYGTYTK